MNQTESYRLFTLHSCRATARYIGIFFCLFGIIGVRGTCFSLERTTTTTTTTTTKENNNTSNHGSTQRGYTIKSPTRAVYGQFCTGTEKKNTGGVNLVVCFVSTHAQTQCVWLDTPCMLRFFFFFFKRELRDTKHLLSRVRIFDCADTIRLPCCTRSFVIFFTMAPSEPSLRLRNHC